MTAPIRPDSEFDKWKAEQEFAAWKAQQAPAVREGPPAKPATVDRLRSAGVVAQTAADAYSFGGIGLVDDAISSLKPTEQFGRSGLPLLRRESGAFRQSRESRRTNRENLSGGARIGATVAGALANPVGAGFRAAQGAGLLARTAVGAGNAMLQGGAMAGTEALDEFSPEGIKRAAVAGAKGAGTGLLAAGALGVGQGLASGFNTLRRVYQAKPLDVVRHEMQDAMRAADDVNFGRVRGEAAGPATKEVTDVLRTQTIAPFAQLVRNSEEFAGAGDNTVLLEAYKRMSEAQRKSARAQEGSAELLAGIAQKGRDIGLAKGRMLDASDASIPSLRPSNAVHAEARGNIEAFENTADAIQRIINKRAQKGEKILLDSPEALRKAIAEMSPAEARAALEGALGRTREVAKLSTNIITGFGIPGAIVRTAIAPHQINPYLQLLQKQAGMRQSPFDSPVLGGSLRAAGARIAGGLLAP